jgi:hypothetical protein
MFHLVRETSLFRATMMFRDSAKVSLTRESCARNDVNVSTMLFTVCPRGGQDGFDPQMFEDAHLE